MTGNNNNDFNNQKPNYNESQYNRDYYSNTGQNYQQSDYVPQSYGMSSRYDDLYDYEEESGSGSFLAGALVGVVIGAAAALFLAPKSGKEFRGDLNTQVTSLKEKTQGSGSDSEGGGLKQQLKDQSSKVVDKVKGMKGGTSPMDDGTASSEGEESIELHATIQNSVYESNKETETAGEDAFTSTANALKEAVEEVNEDKKSAGSGSNSNDNKSGNTSNKNNSGNNNSNKNNSSNSNSNSNSNNKNNSNGNKNNSTK